MIPLIRDDTYDIPEYMWDGLLLYINKGIEPGSFLRAVICNDLKGSLAAADYINRTHLFDYVSFLYNEAPMGCFGSPDNYAMWIENGGLEAME